MRPAIGAVFFASAALASLGIANPPGTGVSRSIAAVAPRAAAVIEPAAPMPGRPAATAPAPAPPRVALATSVTESQPRTTELTPPGADLTSAGPRTVVTAEPAVPASPPVVLIARLPANDPSTALEPEAAATTLAATAADTVATVAATPNLASHRNVAAPQNITKRTVARTAKPAKPADTPAIKSKLAVSKLAVSKLAVNRATVAPAKRNAQSAVLRRNKR